MDPVTVGIISGLVVEGLKATVRLGHRIDSYDLESFFDADDLRLSLEGETSLSSILAKSAESITFSGELLENFSEERLAAFFTSPEIESLTRQIYASRLIDETRDSLGMIRREFKQLVQLKLQVEGDGNGIDGLFELLLTGCDKGLEIAIENGVIVAHEARASFRYRVLRDELATLQKNVDFLTQGGSLDIERVLEFEEEYRQQVAARYGSITPPYVDVARRLPIDELYVSPSFAGAHEQKGEELEQFKTPELLSTMYRAVLLGNPGSGKSTFTHKLSFDLAKHYLKRLFAGKQLTPILVVLRDYGAEKKATNCSILQFVEKKANADHQLEPPRDAFKYLLLNGRAVVIFDGLDELLDTSYRQEISRDVESFCNLYPSVPVLVTSREVGYEQAPLDERRFEKFRLSSFDDEQVEEYVTKWFAVNTDMTVDQRQRETTAFIAESQIVPDLRANPLMLGLMCNIYRGENYIPRNRPDVYRKCAEMLFERWDRSRGVHYSLPFEAHVRPTMTYLAYWIYSDEALQGGATESQLISKAADYLYPDRFDDRDEAEMAARQFIEFCRGRAWVFTDTGTMSRGERLYQFTHRTFLEYFTAQYLTRTYYTPQELINVLLPRIAKREWDIVAQLAFQIQSEAADGAGDELLTALLKRASDTQHVESWNCLSFSARCLEFMVPSAKIRTNVSVDCAQRCIEWGADQLREGSDSDPWLGPSENYFGPAEILASLQNVGDENLATVANAVEQTVAERMLSNDDFEASAAFEVAITLAAPFLLSTPRIGLTPRRTDSERWKELYQSLFDDHPKRARSLSKMLFQLCYTGVSDGKIGIEDLVRWHGAKALFQSRPYTMTPVRMVPLAEHYVGYLHGTLYSTSNQAHDTENAYHNLKRIGFLALSSSMPWVDDTRSLDPFLGYILGEHRQKSSKRGGSADLDAHTLFGVFVSVGTVLELEAGHARPSVGRLLETLRNDDTLLFGHLRRVLASRFDGIDRREIQQELHKSGLNADQQAFIWRWTTGDINLVLPSNFEQDTHTPVDNL